MMFTRRQSEGEASNTQPTNVPTGDLSPVARGMALRETARRSLRKVCVLPSSGQMLAEAYGTADTPDALATSLQSLASLLESRRAEATTEQLAMYDRILLTAELVTEMRAVSLTLAS